MLYLPKFSVLISVYNKEKPEYLNNSLISIWDNQNHKPNQIVLVCDGELTLDLYLIINTWKKRLNKYFYIVQLKKNLGLALALNEGLKHCKYDYVARMDSDDISSPDRFIKQLNYLNKYPNTTLLGSNVLEFKHHISCITNKKYVPTSHKVLQQYIKYRNPINHMSVIFNKHDILKVGGYTDINGYEDYLLWAKLYVNGFILQNLNENLVYARIDNNFIARRKGLKFFKNEIKLQYEFYNLGLISIHIFVFNLLFRSGSRLLPTFFLNIIYNKLRK